MKILQISSIFPIKMFPFENPYVKNFINHYKKGFENDEVLVAKPITYYPNAIIPFKKNKDMWERRRELAKRESEMNDGIHTTYLPYISIGSVSLLHVLGSHLCYLRNSSRFKNLIKDVDIMHSHYLFPDGLLAYNLKRTYNIPYVLTLRQETRFLKNKISQEICRKIIENASACTTQSYHMHRALLNLNFNNVELLPTGIENYFFGSKRDSKKASNKKLNVVSVCNLMPIKNLKSVILAIKEYDLQSQIIYHIYGSGPEEKNLKELTINLGLDSCIKFMGRVQNSELPDIYSKYDLFVQPSFKETFGLTYFEALACKLPVLLSENTGAYPLIKEYDVSYVVDPNSITSIGKCLKDIVLNPEQLKRKQRRTAEAAKIASWDNYIDYFHEAYRTAIV